MRRLLLGSSHYCRLAARPKPMVLRFKVPRALTMVGVTTLFLLSVFSCVSPQTSAPTVNTRMAPIHFPTRTITVEVLHGKFYPFSRRLFDGTSTSGLMQLTARLRNVSSSPVTVSTYALAVISVTSITYKPGPPKEPFPISLPQTLQPAEGAFLSEDDPYSVASQYLVTLAPQVAVEFPITVIGRLDLTPGVSRKAYSFSPPGPGIYSLTFSYSYGGPDLNFPEVLRGTETAMPITVGVR
jgi:hypothetical protein